MSHGQLEPPLSPLRRLQLVFCGGIVGAISAFLIVTLMCFLGALIGNKFKIPAGYVPYVVYVASAFAAVGLLQGVIAGFFHRNASQEFIFEVLAAPFAFMGVVGVAGEAGCLILALFLAPGGALGWWLAGFVNISPWIGLIVGVLFSLVLMNAFAMSVDREKKAREAADA